MIRQGTDDELSSSPADRDAWARVGTVTGSNLAVSGKAAWFGTSTAGESRRMVRAGTSPDEELAATGAEDLQGRASGELADTGVQPEEPGRFPAYVGRIPVWREGPVQDRADGGHSFSYSLPRLRITGPLTYTDKRGKPTAVDVSGSGWADSQWGDFFADQDW